MIVEKGFFLVGGWLGSMKRGRLQDEMKHLEEGPSGLRRLNMLDVEKELIQSEMWGGETERLYDNNLYDVPAVLLEPPYK